MMNLMNIDYNYPVANLILRGWMDYLNIAMNGAKNGRWGFNHSGENSTQFWW
jgi:hypothetical protein